MKKYLVFTEGTADKFWQIDVQGNQFTVTWGKNGTQGTSQVKVFDTEESCLRQAEKLLAEKQRKGYSEEGTASPQTGGKHPSADKQAARQAVLDTYDHIIRTKNLKALLPFLQEEAKGHRDALKKHISKTRRYWLRFVDLTLEPEFRGNTRGQWGRRGDELQQNMIVLSAIALFDKKEITSWGEVPWLLEEAVKNEAFLQIIRWAAPEWLDAFLLEHLKKNQWLAVSYQTLRRLERERAIRYNPELFALCISQYRLPGVQFASVQEIKRALRALTEDPVACERDIPALFIYETALHSQQMHYRAAGTNQRESVLVWELVYGILLETGKMDRQFLIENALQIQTKEWNNALKGFFRKLLEDVNLTPEELIRYQETIFPCLHVPFPQVVSFGAGCCKAMAKHPDFQGANFLDWVAPVLVRNDCKAAIKMLLPVLETLARAYAALRAPISEAVADVFMIPDMALQERAAKLLLKVEGVDNEALVEKLTMYSPLMQGNIPTLLARWIAGTPDGREEVIQPYQRLPFQPKALLTEPLRLPDTWNDILFWMGAFIRSDDPCTGEVLVNAFLCQQSLFPADYREQVAPYTRQLEKMSFNSSQKEEIRVFLLHKIQHPKVPYIPKTRLYSRLKTLQIARELITITEEYLQQGTALPLLCLPTHAPCWVAPDSLLERIIAHQARGSTLHAVDLSLAIARMPREGTEKALPLLPLVKGEIRQLMEFCLGVHKNIPYEETSFLSKIRSIVGFEEKKSLDIALWAVAARTFYPQERFSVFEKTPIYKLPFVVEPFHPEVYFKELWSEWLNYLIREPVRTSMGVQLCVRQPAMYGCEIPLLYSLDARPFQQTDWQAQLHTAANVSHWHSMMPQNPDPLALKLLRDDCRMASLGTEALQGFLEILHRPECWLSETSTLVLACSLLKESKDLRLRAAETLIRMIEQQKLEMTLLGEKTAFLISGGYAGLARFAEALALVKDTSPLHNSALFQLLDALFGALDVPEKLPAHFKKLVEHYVDLAGKTRQKPSPQTRAFFDQLRDNASLKALIKQLLMPE